MYKDTLYIKLLKIGNEMAKALKEIFLLLIQFIEHCGFFITITFQCVCVCVCVCDDDPVLFYHNYFDIVLMTCRE
jgi:hypothetical protein